MNRLQSVSVSLFAALLCGCATPRGVIQTGTSTVIGMEVSKDPESSFPHLRLGFMRSQKHTVPTSKEAIFAPPVQSSISLNHHLMTTEIEEDFATGILATSGTSPETTAQRAVNRKAKKEDK
jgi:hypothetical protein